MKDTRVTKAVRLFQEAQEAVDNIYKLVGREVIKLNAREFRKFVKEIRRADADLR